MIRVGIAAYVLHFLRRPSLGIKGAADADQKTGKELDSAQSFGDGVRYQVGYAAAGQTDERDEGGESRADAAGHARSLPADGGNVVEGGVSTAFAHDDDGAGIFVQNRVVASSERRQVHGQIATVAVFHGSLEPIGHVKAEAAHQRRAEGEETPDEPGGVEGGCHRLITRMDIFSSM